MRWLSHATDSCAPPRRLEQALTPSTGRSSSTSDMPACSGSAVRCHCRCQVGSVMHSYLRQAVLHQRQRALDFLLENGATPSLSCASCRLRPEPSGAGLILPSIRMRRSLSLLRRSLQRSRRAVCARCCPQPSRHRRGCMGLAVAGACAGRQLGGSSEGARPNPLNPQPSIRNPQP